MSAGAVRVRAVRHVETTDTRAAGGAQPGTSPPLPQLAAPADGAAGPLETAQYMAQLEASFGDAIGSGDPAALMVLLASRIRSAQGETASAEMSANRAQSRARFQAQCEAFRRAEAAQGESDFWNTVARVATYCVAGATIAVGLTSSVFTGGASVLAAVAVTASLLSSAATIGVMAAQDTGLMHDRPEWLTIGLGVLAMVGGLGGFVQGGLLGAVGATATVVSQGLNVGTDALVALRAFPEPGPELRWTLAAIGLIGAGLSVAGSLTTGSTSNAQGSGASRAAVRTLNVSARAVQGSGQVVQGTTGIAHAVCEHDHDSAEADASAARRGIARLQQRSEAVLDSVRDALATYQRAVQRAMTASQDVQAARVQLGRNMARA